MEIGKFNVSLVDTGIFSLDGGAMFGVVPKVLWSKKYHKGDELNRVPLSSRPLLVKSEGKNLLIDTGNGNKYEEKYAKIYDLDLEKSSMDNALKQSGLSALDIDYVIITHLHFDHAGGGTIYRNGKLEPTFPNAKYFVQKEHLNWAMNPTEKDRASFFKENYEPLLADGLLETIDGAGQLFDGIDVIPLDGHTKGMQVVKISDEGKTLLYCADFLPTAAHIYVPFVPAYDNFPLQTIEEKKQLLPIAYEEGWIMAFEHDAFVDATKVAIENDKFIPGEVVKVNI